MSPEEIRAGIREARKRAAQYTRWADAARKTLTPLTHRATDYSDYQRWVQDHKQNCGLPLCQIEDLNCWIPMSKVRPGMRLKTNCESCREQCIVYLTKKDIETSPGILEALAREAAWEANTAAQDARKAQEAVERERQKIARLSAVESALHRLGLTWRATRDDVIQAYRHLAKIAHPDAGGSAEAFVQLKADRDLAMRLVKETV